MSPSFPAGRARRISSASSSKSATRPATSSAWLGTSGRSLPRPSPLRRLVPAVSRVLARVRAFGRWASVAADSVWVLGPSVSAVLPLMLGLALTSCEPGTGSPPRTADASGASRPFAAAGLDTAAIADTLRALVEDAYDFSRPGVVERLMSLYPDSGPVISAAAGRVTTSRDSLRAQIEWFWNYVGQNMQDPRWEWTASHVRVLGPDAAVLTASYRVPHRTPEGRPHIVGGAWTMVFERRDGRWVIVQEHLSDLPPEQQRSGR